MENILIIIHIIVSIFLIIIVLLQQGKGADIGATFGGGGGNTLFGTEGPMPLMNKVTTTAAVIFMVTSISLAYISAHVHSGSVMKDQAVSHKAAAPAPPVDTGKAGDLAVPRPTADAVEDKAPATFPGADQQKGSAAPTEKKKAASKK